MKTLAIFSFLFTLVVVLLCSSATSMDKHGDFLKCLKHEFQKYSSISNLVYTQTNSSSFISILRSSIRNLRYATPTTPKPKVIITPDHESQIPPVICCARRNGLEIRTRSGGHDFEGLSYVAQVPFVVIDLVNLSEITVNVEHKTAWVGGGATIGSLYYGIAEKTPVLGFPAGVWLSLGVGGHFGGGGYGAMTRKYGLSSDNVIDARIVDARGRILDRESMGEDLFWAIRGGGGASFGVITAWKVQLVDVPETVTVFNVKRTLEQNATQIIQRWQHVAPELDPDLTIRIMANRVNTTITVTFYSLFLGGADELAVLMQEKFPELGVARQDCIETSWVKSTQILHGLPIEMPLEVLLNRNQAGGVGYHKIKSSYVQRPIPESGLEGVWRHLREAEAIETAFVVLSPYGGRMAEISESATAFPHRAGNLYLFSFSVTWGEDEARDSDKYIRWTRRLYEYLTPYVAEGSYYNYNDLDLGVNNVVGETSYAQASVWGKKYFGNNFDRLVRVKGMVDPHNFFRNLQSIVPNHI